MEFVAIAVIMIFVLIYTNRIDAKRFLGDVEPYFKMLM